MAISDQYVSPNLRIAFAREDHPNMVIDTQVVPIAESGIPAMFTEGCAWVVICTITVPGHVPVQGIKAIPRQTRLQSGKMVDTPMDPETFVKYETIATGRALKRFGYPDKAPEFKLLLLWRERNRQILGSAPGGPALPAGPSFAGELDAALHEAGGEPADTADDPDDRDDDRITDAEIMDQTHPADQTEPAPPPHPATETITRPADPSRPVRTVDPHTGEMKIDPKVLFARLATADPEVQASVKEVADFNDRKLTERAFADDQAWATVVLGLIDKGVTGESATR